MDSSEPLHATAEQPLLPQLAALRHVAQDTTDIMRSRLRRRRLALAIAIPCLAVAVVLPVDALSDLSAHWRVVLVAVTALSSVIVALLAIRPSGPMNPLATAEGALGETDRRLTAATQLRQQADPRAQAQAAVLAANFPQADALRDSLSAGLPAARAWPVLAVAGGAVLSLGVLGWVWPHLLAACGPRLWDPYGDHPPYSSTRLHWVNPPAQAPYNESVTLTVAVDGPAPTDLVLHVMAENAPEAAEVHLLPAGDGKWNVRLEPPIQPLRLWVAGAGTRTPWLDLALDGIPRLRRSLLTLKAPSYANLPDTTVRADGRGTPPMVQALPGSSLHLELACSRVPQAVWLQLNQGIPERRAVSGTPQRSPLLPGGDALAPIDLADPTPGAWSVSLEGPDGARGPPMPLITVERRSDAMPTVRVVMPAENGYATPGSTVPFVVQASDDLGLSRLTTYRLVNDTQTTEDRHSMGGTGDTWRGSLILDGVKPKDVVRLGAVARDTMPPDGQVSTPSEVVLTIIALDQYLILVSDQLDEQALMTRFAPVFAELAALEEEARRLAEMPGSPARDRQLAALDKKLTEARQKFAEQAKLELFATDGEVFKAVDERLAELQEQGKAGFPTGTGPDKAKPLSKELESVTAEAEADAAQEWVADLAKAQRALNKEFADLQNSPLSSDQAKARMRAAAAQQRELEQAIRELEEHSADIANTLEASDPKQAEHMRMVAKALSETAPAAQQAAREAGRGKAEPAAGHAGDAATRLEALVAKKRMGQGEGEGKPGSCSGDKLGQCRSQLAAMAKRGMGQGGSPNSSGIGGALGQFGGGMYVRRGGNAGTKTNTIPLYGPLATLAPAGNKPGGLGKKGHSTASPEAQIGTEAATPYNQGVRSTTAGLGASLTPAEEVVVDDYYRRLVEPLPPPVSPAYSPPPALLPKEK